MVDTSLVFLGDPPEQGGLVGDGLLSDWIFDENGVSGTTVLDQGPGASMDLTIGTPANTTQQPTYLTISGLCRIATPGPASKLISACRVHNGLTIEAWIRPLNTTQAGPARIATCSPSPEGEDSRNFMLGAGSFGGAPTDAYYGRCRTAQSDADGWIGTGFGTGAGTAQTVVQHVVMTVEDTGSDQRVRIYVNNHGGSWTSYRNEFIAGDSTFSDDGPGDPAAHNGWDESFLLTLFAEQDQTAGNSRFWRGDAFRVRTYYRGLTEEEVRNNFYVGWDEAGAPPVPVVSFSVPTSQVFEDAGTHSILVTADASAPLSYPIPLVYGGDTSKLSSPPASVTMPAGQTQVAIPLTIIDTGSADAAFTVTLDPDAGDATVSGGAHTCTVLDLDVAPTIALESSSASHNRAIPSFQVAVVSSRPYRSAITVSIVDDTSGGAVGDYVLPSTVQIPAKQLTAQITVSSIEDNSETENEDIDFHVASPSPAGSIGAPSAFTLTLLPAGTSSASFPYFEKTGGSLNFMGVSLTRTSGGQTVWAPGSPTQEYPGGWVTPGNYTVNINTSRIHGDFHGVLTGSTRGGASILYVKTSQPHTWYGWHSWGFELDASFQLQTATNGQTISLSAGDTLHLGYGILGVNSKHVGSDGMTVHCVAAEPEYRCGFWGSGRQTYDASMWAYWTEKSNEMYQEFAYNNSQTTASIPSTIPEDYGNSVGQTTNRQGAVVSDMIMHRAAKWKQLGPGSVNEGDLRRLIEFFFNNVQMTGHWGEACSSHNFFGHGPDWYPSYFFTGPIMHVVLAAAMLGYTPDFEPMHKMLMACAQRTNMSLAHWGGAYCHENNNVPITPPGQGDSHIDWIHASGAGANAWNHGSHRNHIWANCYLARLLMQQGDTDVSAYTRDKVGRGFYFQHGTPAAGHCAIGGDSTHDFGHVFTLKGVGPWNGGYTRLEVGGVKLILTLHPPAQHWDICRRGSLNPHCEFTSLEAGIVWQHHFEKRFIRMPGNVNATPGSGQVSLSWSAPTYSKNGLASYTVKRTTTSGADLTVYDAMTVRQAGVATPSFVDSSVTPGTTYRYAVVAVDVNGNTSCPSEIVVATPS